MKSQPQRSWRAPLGVGLSLLSLLVVALVWGRPAGPDPSPGPATPTRLEQAEARLSGELREALVSLAGGKRADLSPLRERALRAGLDPLALEAAALEATESECGAALASTRDPAKTYRALREALDPSLRDRSLRISEHAFRVLVEAPAPNWLEVARLSEAIRPEVPPAFVSAAATIALRTEPALERSATLARACLQLDVTVRDMGTILWQSGRVPAETYRQEFASGSATKAFLKMLKVSPGGAEALKLLRQEPFDDLESLARKVEESPVQDLGRQYLCEAELLLLHCAERRGATLEELRKRAARLRIRLEGHHNLGLRYEVMTYERSMSRPSRVGEVTPPERELVNLFLHEPLRPKLTPQDRSAMLAKAGHLLLLDLVAFGEWEAARSLLRELDDHVPKVHDWSSAGSFPRFSPLCRASETLTRAPLEVVRATKFLADDPSPVIWVASSRAKLLQARAYLQLEEKSAARAVLESIRDAPPSWQGWELPIRAARERILAQLDQE